MDDEAGSESTGIGISLGIVSAAVGAALISDIGKR